MNYHYGQKRMNLELQEFIDRISKQVPDEVPDKHELIIQSINQSILEILEANEITVLKQIALNNIQKNLLWL